MHQIIISAILTLIAWKLSEEHQARNLALLGALIYIAFIADACAVNTAAQAVSQIATIIAAVNLVLGGLTELKKLIADYHKTPSDSAPATIQAATTDLQNNPKGTETAGHTADPATVTKVNAVVQVIIRRL